MARREDKRTGGSQSDNGGQTGNGGQSTGNGQGNQSNTNK